MNKNKTTLPEIMPELKVIAKEYNLDLSKMSDFKLARALWARSKRKFYYEENENKDENEVG
jgi:DNA-binding transcriptional regulator GbsR (MarR family)